MSTDLAAQARSYSRTAGAATRRAEADAHQAQSFYDTAARTLFIAARLTQDPGRWLPEAGYTPARFEADARNWVRVADTFLRSSFHNTGVAAHYRQLAASYRDMAARYRADWQSSVTSG